MGKKKSLKAFQKKENKIKNSPIEEIVDSEHKRRITNFKYFLDNGLFENQRRTEAYKFILSKVISSPELLKIANRNRLDLVKLLRKISREEEMEFDTFFSSPHYEAMALDCFSETKIREGYQILTEEELGKFSRGEELSGDLEGKFFQEENSHLYSRNQLSEEHYKIN